jgi:hypothetical protein
MEGVYIMHTRECLNAKLPIYKLGRSHQLDKRVKQYPTGSQIICMLPCKLSIICEQLLIEIFKTKFIHQKTYGNEYFEGDYELMVQTIIDTLFNHKNNILENFKKLKEEKKVKQIEKKKEKRKLKLEESNIKQETEQQISIATPTTILQDVKINKTSSVKNYLSCPKCKITFKYKSLLKTHFSKAYHCILSKEDIDKFFKIDMYKCTHCKKDFTNLKSYTRHKKETKCCIY